MGELEALLHNIELIKYLNKVAGTYSTLQIGHYALICESTKTFEGILSHTPVNKLIDGLIYKHESLILDNKPSFKTKNPKKLIQHFIYNEFIHHNIENIIKENISPKKLQVHVTLGNLLDIWEIKLNANCFFYIVIDNQLHILGNSYHQALEELESIFKCNNDITNLIKLRVSIADYELHYKDKDLIPKMRDYLGDRVNKIIL